MSSPSHAWSPWFRKHLVPKSRKPLFIGFLQFEDTMVAANTAPCLWLPCIDQLIQDKCKYNTTCAIASWHLVRQHLCMIQVRTAQEKQKTASTTVGDLRVATVLIHGVIFCMKACQTGHERMPSRDPDALITNCALCFKSNESHHHAMAITSPLVSTSEPISVHEHTSTMCRPILRNTHLLGSRNKKHSRQKLNACILSSTQYTKIRTYTSFVYFRTKKEIPSCVLYKKWSSREETWRATL